MRNQLKPLLLAFVFLQTQLGWLAPTARAGVENRNIYPLGATEAFEGNSGTARAASSGGVYYNPAGLAWLEGHSISGGGTAYALSRSNLESFFTVDNTNVPYKANSFEPIPTSVVSTKRLDGWTGGFFFLVPESLKFQNRTTIKTQNTENVFSEVQESRDMWAGVSGARKLSSALSIGASFFLVRHSDFNSFTTVTNNTTVADTTSFEFLQVQAQVWSVSGTLGVLYRASGQLNLGLRVELPKFRVIGWGSGIESVTRVSNGSVSNLPLSESLVDNISATYETPWDSTFGARYEWEHFSFNVDLSLQLGKRYDPFGGSGFSSRTVSELDTTARANLGLGYDWSKTFYTGLGYLNNPSAVHSLNDKDQGSTRENFQGITAGMVFRGPMSRSGVGFFYLWSHGQVLPYSTNSTPAASNKRIFGLILSTFYSL